jgi:hypothetical protein
MSRQHLHRRLVMLRNLEFFNVFFLPFCLVVILRRFEIATWILIAYTLFLVAFILLQGALYWHLKIKALRDGHGLPQYFLPCQRI